MSKRKIFDLGKVPEFIRIGAIDWRVKVTTKGYQEKDKQYYGETSLFECKIRINPEQHPSVARSTLVHEILHGIFAQTPTDLSCAEEEELIRKLEPFLTDTLQRNPSLVNYLMEDTGYVLVQGGA